MGEGVWGATLRCILHPWPGASGAPRPAEVRENRMRRDSRREKHLHPILSMLFFFSFSLSESWSVLRRKQLLSALLSPLLTSPPLGHSELSYGLVHPHYRLNRL